MFRQLYDVIDRTPVVGSHTVNTISFNMESREMESNLLGDETTTNSNTSIITTPQVTSTKQRPTAPQIPPRNLPQKEENMEQMFARMAETFTQALQQAAERTIPPQYARPKPTCLFSGFEHESPEAFIYHMETYFLRANITDDEDKLIHITDQLRGEAKKWYEPYKYLINKYSTFLERLRSKYDSTTIITQATSRLYGEKQANNESGTVFITRKVSLFNRLDPHKMEKMKVCIILDQLKPEIRSRLRGHNIETVEQLVSVVTQIELDLAEINKIQQPAWRTNSNNANYTPTSRNHNASTSLSPTRQSAEPPRQPIMRSNGDAPSNMQAHNSRPPTPCRYCPTESWHYHAECPNNPRRTENFRGAGARIALQAPPATHTQPQANTSQPNGQQSRQNAPTQQVQRSPPSQPSTSRQPNSQYTQR